MTKTTLILFAVLFWQFIAPQVEHIYLMNKWYDCTHYSFNWVHLQVVPECKTHHQD